MIVRQMTPADRVVNQYDMTMGKAYEFVEFEIHAIPDGHRFDLFYDNGDYVESFQRDREDAADAAARFLATV